MAHQSKIPIKEGFIPFNGYKTWYRIVGTGDEPGKLPHLPAWRTWRDP